MTKPVRYSIETVGASFTNKDVTSLAARFTQGAARGYRLHSMVPIQQPGCLGIGAPTTTYIAIYEKIDDGEEAQ